MSALPWSKNKLERLGKCIRDDQHVPEGIPPYSEVMGFFNDQAVHVQQRIEEIDFTPLLKNRRFEVTSRPKTIDTLKQKLQRNRTIQLPYVQDLAGVRFEAEMTLDEQDGVANAILGAFGHNAEGCLQDLRSVPHSGYRAVHLRLQLPARVEVQVRTHLQGAWANMYEVAADVFGRDIRYDLMPEAEDARKVVRSLHMLSIEAIAPLEDLRNRIGTMDAEREDMLRLINRLSKRDRGEELRKYRETQNEVDALRSQVLDLEGNIQEQLIALTEVFRKIRKEVTHG